MVVIIKHLKDQQLPYNSRVQKVKNLLQELTTPYWCWGLFHGAICNLKTRLLPFTVKEKTHECSLKIQPESNRCRCSPDDPPRYRPASPRDTHVVALAGDLRLWRIIGPTWSAAWDIHCVVKCTAQSNVCQRGEITYVRMREGGGSSNFGGGLRRNVSVYLFFFLCGQSSSMLIRALASLPLMTSQVRGDVKKKGP